MNKSTAKQLLALIGLPVLFAFLVRFAFGADRWDSLYSVMTIAFIFFLPMAVGAITIYLSDIDTVKKLAYRIIMPWVPIFAFFILTLLLSIEGFACWIMILPVFMVFSSIGGLIAGHFKIKNKKEKLNISLLLLLPFFISPIEQSIRKIPSQYEAYTFIDIHAPKAIIWQNVTRVKTISTEENTSWFTVALGLPRPIKAELNYEGVGASREAIFDKGLVFHETVVSYEPQKKMVFSIKANPHDIPSTTMDEHIVVGGKYFDVLNGTYELQQINDTICRLHLYSHFKLTTSFNFYANWWAGWIMKDIQNNILHVIKRRSEKLFAKS